MDDKIEVVSASGYSRPAIKNERHCGNCLWFDGDDTDEDLRLCEAMPTEVYRPKWGRCPMWRNKNET